MSPAMKIFRRNALWLLPLCTAAFVPKHNMISRHASLLSMSKDNERARVERNFEAMMGDDWRVFRAKLIAQERAQDIAILPYDYHDETLMRQDHLGNMFANAYSALHAQDPFVSKVELPIHLQSKVTVDKHRWAHRIAHVEPGCVLVANEWVEGVFHQTVILLVGHDETGFKGIIINRPLQGDLSTIASETDSNVDLSVKMGFNSARVGYGGPVKTYDYSILHGYGEVEGAKKLAPGVFVGGTPELLNEVRANNFSPEEALFIKGWVEWAPGQLSEEIGRGVWYTAAVSSDFILRYAGAPVYEQDNPHDLWSDILMCMGDEYADIAVAHAGYGDMRMMP